MKQYNKLIRDKILEIIERKGGASIFHIADNREYKEKLTEKLHEEIEEFAKAKSRKAREEELADILEVIYALRDFFQISRSQLEKTRKKKHSDRGGFKKRIILEKS